MAGSALSLFTDFFTHTTGPAYLTGPEVVINDAQLRNFEAYEAFSRMKMQIQGGSTIKDMIFLNDPLTASTYLPGESATIVNTQSGTTITVPWRFVRSFITWTEQEILLNEGGGVSDGEGQFHQFKRLRDFKYQQSYTSLLNLMERLLVQTANNAAMELATGRDPYSVFATVTTDGLAPAGFTTVQGINPTTEASWRNQNATYTFATPFDTDNGIIAGFDNISQLVVFKRPPTSQEYFTDSQFRSLVIFTNKEGRRDYMKAIRANNDITRAGPQDPAYGDPVFNMIPVKYVEGFDDQNSFTAGQPDFLFFNMQFMEMIFHREKFMQVSDPMTFADKPDTTVVWVDTYCNLFQKSRQRQGYLAAA